jgi:hypothetical protein
MCESNTAALCKKMGMTQSKPLAERYGNGMGTAWERHGMCEFAFKVSAAMTKEKTEIGIIVLLTSTPS